LGKVSVGGPGPARRGFVGGGHVQGSGEGRPNSILMALGVTDRHVGAVIGVKRQMGELGIK